MALWKLNRGEENNLPAVKTDGYVYFCQDNGHIYFDYIDDDGKLRRQEATASLADKIKGIAVDGQYIEITAAEIKACIDELDNVDEKITTVVESCFNGVIVSKEIITSEPEAPYNDCNTLPSNSCVSYAYYVNSSRLSNKPDSFNNGTVVTLAPKAGTSIMTQIAVSGKNVMWHRSRYGNAWTAWVREMTDDSVHSRNYTTISMFDRVGIVGDSYASGATYGVNDTNDGEHYGIAWGRVLAKRNNISVDIFAASGLSTKTWLENSNGLPALLSRAPKDLYLLCLGINDNKTGADPIGTIADIDDEDYTKNSNTFCGNYGRIVSQTMKYAPLAKIVFVVPPGYKTNNIGKAISEIAAHYAVPFICFDDDPFVMSSFYKDNIRTGHPVSITYAGMSAAIERLFAKCAIDNPTYFANFTSSYTSRYNNEGTELLELAETQSKSYSDDKQREIVGAKYTEHNGYFAANGDVNSQSTDKLEKYTDKISVAKGDTVRFVLDYGDVARSAWATYMLYDTTGAIIGTRNIIVNNQSRKSVSATLEIAENAGYIAFSYRTYGSYTLSVDIFTDFQQTKESFSLLRRESASRKTGAYLTKPCYDHLFVNRVGGRITIPHQSLYHVRISKALGFEMIEANTQVTSDGVYVVNHFTNGKFGAYFDSADGTTDISDIAVSSVTWDWIVENVRYKSSIQKYRTRPCRLEEFLAECRQQNITPFLQAKSAQIVKLARKYMGANNFVVYGATRAICPTEIIYDWVNNGNDASGNYIKATPETALARCEKYGRPYIYGLAYPEKYTDAELQDIIDTLHTNGYCIGTSYADSAWYRYISLGFDLNGTTEGMNRIIIGNKANFDSMFGFDEFVITNATEANGVLTFTSTGTIKPGVDAVTYSACGVDIEIDFTGTITIPDFGEHGVRSYTSDGSVPVFVCVPVINGNPYQTIAVTSGTVIKDIKYKVIGV